VFLAALVLRLVHVNDLQSAPFFHYPIGDSGLYHERALDIAAGDLIGDEAYWHSSPFYPYFLAAIYLVAGPDLLIVRVVQALVGSLNCVVILLLTRVLVGDRRGPPLIAGLTAAAYGTFVFFDGDILMIPLVLLFSSTCVLLLVSGIGLRRAFLAGVLLGLAGLGKPNVLLFAPVAVLWILTELRRSVNWRNWRPALLFAAGAMLAVFPITMRNYVVSNDFVLVSSNAGVNLFIGNNSRAQGVFRLPPDSGLDNKRLYLSSREVAEAATGAGRLKPSEVSAYWTQRALEDILDQREAWLALMWQKFRLAWNAYEIPNHHDKYFIAINFSPILNKLAIGFWLVAPLAVVGVLIRARREASSARRLYLAFALTYLLSLLPFFVTARYRLPIVPFLIVFASVGVCGLWDLMRRHEYRRLLVVSAAGTLSAVFVNWPLMSFPFFSSHRWMASSYAHLATMDRENEETHLHRAILEIKKALELRPKAAAMHYNLGSIYVRIGHYSGAAAQLERALALQPGLPNAASALRDVQTALTKPGDRTGQASIPQTPFEAGVSAASKGDLTAARRHFEAAIRSDPHHAAAHGQLGALYLARGDNRAAARWFERGLEYSPSDFALNNGAAEAHHRMGNVETALRYWNKCLRIDPGNDEVTRQIESAQMGASDQRTPGRVD
jgi:tetratricopeptide (TPR) repeat protein